MTKHMREVAGGLRAVDEVNEHSDKKGDTNYTYKPHKIITANDIPKAVEEAKKQIISQGKLLLEMNKKKELQRRRGLSSPRFRDDIEEHLRQLVSTNPAAVGQILANYPEFAQLTCNIIDQIEKEDKTDAKRDKAFMWGGLIVGGVLVVATGGMALALYGVGGAAAVAAGTATAATVGSLTTGIAVATAAGLGAGLIEAGYYGHEMLEARREHQNMDAAFFGGSADDQIPEDSRQALADFKEARLMFGLSAGFAAAELGGMAAAVKLGSLSAKTAGRALSSAEKTKKIKAVTENLRSMRQAVISDPQLTRAFTSLKSTLGQQKLGKFMGWLAQVPSRTRFKFLNKMKDWKNERIRQVANEVLEMAKKCE